MSDKLLLFIAMMMPVLLICCGLVLWRWRRWSSARADAERRAAVALEELNRVSAKLRRQTPTD